MEQGSIRVLSVDDLRLLREGIATVRRHVSSIV